MLLFVGLGNPTPDSENNRHNVGFKIIDSINKKFGLSKQKPKFIMAIIGTIELLLDIPNIKNPRETIPTYPLAKPSRPSNQFIEFIKLTIKIIACVVV